jgi:hypothetical protein
MAERVDQRIPYRYAAPLTGTLHAFGDASCGSERWRSASGRSSVSSRAQKAGPGVDFELQKVESDPGSRQ